MKHKRIAQYDRTLQKPRLSAKVTLAAVAGAMMLVFSGCAEQTLKHGQYFTQGDLQQVQPGMSKEQVKLSLGTPSTKTTASSTGSDVYYYISSTAKQAAFFKPKEVDRQVVAIYFTPTGSVDKVANYGLKDGKVFDFITRKTAAPGGKEEGILKALFRNLGTKTNVFGE
jgi:outer membrane protein assembly factor BamE (lipoprotein component of BamABCDE complex)